RTPPPGHGPAPRPPRSAPAAHTPGSAPRRGPVFPCTGPGGGVQGEGRASGHPAAATGPGLSIPRRNPVMTRRVTPIALPALLLLAAAAHAAPAPDPDRAARRSLEALTKKLPDVVSAWAKERWYESHAVKFRSARLLSATEAKVTFVDEPPGDKG